MAIIIQTEKELRKNLFEIFSKMNSNKKNKHSVLNLKYINNSRLLESPTPQETFQVKIPDDSNTNVERLPEEFFKNFLSRNEQLYSETAQDRELQQKLENLKKALNKDSGKVASTQAGKKQQIENDKLIHLVAKAYKDKFAFNWDPNASFLDPLLKTYYTHEELMGDKSGQFANESLVKGQDSYLKMQNALDVTSITLSLIPYISKNRAILKASPLLNIPDAIISLLSLQNRWAYLTTLHEYNVGKEIETGTVDVNGSSATQVRTVKAGELDDAIFWERVFLTFDILGAIPLIGVFSTIILDMCRNSDKLYGQMGRQFAQSPVLIRHVNDAGKVEVKTLSPWITWEELKKLRDSPYKADQAKYKTYVEKAQELGLDISQGVPTYLDPATNVKVFNEVAGNAVADALIVKAEAQLKMSMMLNLEIDDELLELLTKKADLVEWANKIIVKIPDDISKVTDDNWEQLYNFTQKLINQNLIAAKTLDNINSWQDFKKAFNSNTFLQRMSNLRQKVIETFEEIKPNFNLFNTQGPNPKLYGSKGEEYNFDKTLFELVQKYPKFNDLPHDDLKHLKENIYEHWRAVADESGEIIAEFDEFIQVYKNGSLVEFLYRKNAALYFRKIQSLSSFAPTIRSEESLSQLASQFSSLNRTGVEGKQGETIIAPLFSTKKAQIKHVLTDLMNGAIKGVTDDEIAEVVLILQKSLGYNFELLEMIINPNTKTAREFLEKQGLAQGEFLDSINDDLIKIVSDFDTTGSLDNLIVKIPRIIEKGLDEKQVGDLHHKIDISKPEFKAILPIIKESTQNMHVFRDYMLQVLKALNIALGKENSNNLQLLNLQKFVTALVEIANQAVVDLANGAAGPWGIDILGPLRTVTAAGKSKVYENTATAARIREMLAPEFITGASEIGKMAGFINFWKRVGTLFTDRKTLDSIGQFFGELGKEIADIFFAWGKWMNGVKHNEDNLAEAARLTGKMSEIKAKAPKGTEWIIIVFEKVFNVITFLVKNFFEYLEVFIIFYKWILYMQLFASLGQVTVGLCAASLLLGSCSALTTGVCFRFICWLVTNKSPTLFNMGLGLIKNIHHLSTKSLKYFVRFNQKFKEIDETQKKITDIDKLKDAPHEIALNGIINLWSSKPSNNLKENLYNKLVDNVERKTGIKATAVSPEDKKLIEYTLAHDFEFANNSQDKFDNFLNIITNQFDTVKADDVNVEQTYFQLTKESQEQLSIKYQDFCDKCKDDFFSNTGNDNNKYYEKLPKILFFFYLRQKMLNAGVNDEIRHKHIKGIQLSKDEITKITNFNSTQLGFSNQTDIRRVLYFFHTLLHDKSMLLKFKKTFKPTMENKGILNLDAMLTGGLYNVSFLETGNDIYLNGFDLNDAYKPVLKNYNFEQTKTIKKPDGTEESLTYNRTAKVYVPYLRVKGSQSEFNSRLFEDMYALPFEDAEFSKNLQNMIDVRHFQEMYHSMLSVAGVIKRLFGSVMNINLQGKTILDFDWILNGGGQSDENILEEHARKIIRKKLLKEYDLFGNLDLTPESDEERRESEKSNLMSEFRKNQLAEYSNDLKYTLNVSNEISKKDKERMILELSTEIKNKEQKAFEEKYQKSLESDYSLREMNNEFKYFKNYSIDTLLSKPQLIDEMIQKINSNISEFNKIKDKQESKSIFKKFFTANDTSNINNAFKLYQENLLKHVEKLKNQLKEYKVLKNSDNIKDIAAAQKILSEIEKGGIYNPNRGTGNNELVNNLIPGAKVAQRLNLNVKEKFDILNTQSNKLLFFLQSNPAAQGNPELKLALLDLRNKAMVDYINLNLNLVLKNINQDASLILNSLNNFMKTPVYKANGITSTVDSNWAMQFKQEQANLTLGKSVKEYYKTLFSQQIDIGENSFNFNKKGVIEQYQNIIKNIFPETGLIRKEMLSPNDKIIGFYYDHDALNAELSKLGLTKHEIDRVYGDHIVINRLIILSNHGIDELAKQQQNEHLKNLMYIYELDINDLYTKQFETDKYLGIAILNKNSFIQQTFSKKYNVISPSTLQKEEFTYKFDYYQININQEQKIYIQDGTKRVLKNLLDTFREFIPTLLTEKKK